MGVGKRISDSVALTPCLVRVGTEGPNRALGTFRLTGDADAPAVVLQEMAEADALFFGNDGHQVELDFVRVRVFGKSQALRQAHNVSVDADGLLAEGVAEHDVA